jgi:MFS family permease
MFKRIADEIYKFYHVETLAERGKRMLPGAIYCAIAVSLYMIVSSAINVIFFTDLHLAVDWTGLLIRWIGYGIALALAGVIVGWFTESYEGIVIGGVVLAVLLLIANLVGSLISGRGATLLSQSIIITFLPLLIAGILLAGAIRMAINRHMHIQQQEKPEKRKKLLIQLVGLVTLVGLILGVFSLFGSSSLYAIQSMNKTLQSFATDPLIESRFPYDKVPALKAHFGMNYSLYVRTSNIMTSSLEITIHFEDSYSVTCLVPQMGSSEQMLLDVCNEGTAIRFP